MRVELAGHLVRLGELRACPQRYASWFAAARRHPGHATCRCTREGERLAIREVAGLHHLARRPGTRDNHRPDCPFSTVADDHTGVDSAARAAITVTEHGTRIAVGYALTAADQSTDPAGDLAADDSNDGLGELMGSTRPHPATVTGLGLLQWLFESAALNTWPPPDPTPPLRGARPRRGWADVHAGLVVVLAGLRLGAQPAPRLAHVVAPYRPGRPDPAREARLEDFLRPLEHPEQVSIRGGPPRGQTRVLRHRRLLCGEIKDLTAGEHGHKLTLRHFPRPVFLPDDLAAHLARRFPAAFSPRRGPTARRVVLALIEATPHGYLRLVDAAVLLTTAQYIPVDSSHELAFASRLIAARREFVKPLRYDRDEDTLPDFVLTDTSTGTEPGTGGGATVVEVWGVTGSAAYEQRKRAKLARYRAHGVPVLEWTPPEPLPPLPPPADATHAARARRWEPPRVAPSST